MPLVPSGFSATGRWNRLFAADPSTPLRMIYAAAAIPEFRVVPPILQFRGRVALSGLP